MSEEPRDDRESTEAAPAEWSQFSRRLASFGLGETPDPLLTRGTTPKTPAPRRRGGSDAGRRS